MTAQPVKQSADKLLQLSDEVSRIAGTLARLSSAQAASPDARESAGQTARPNISAEQVRSIIRARQLRARFFPAELFADPAWDILLDLYAAEMSQLRVSVSNACIASAVPATTGLRWLKQLERHGLVVRRTDLFDGRRVFVELTPQASLALDRYFGDVGLRPGV